ncbi:UDP-glucose dehydrogenase family protein [Metabacillus litoralis]|uniref:UDP-glucose dehydrogenase family protein n=1 Tax=Metabacillus litoralis TaxID=152268 RepID=UPI001CFCC57B|nr:UDP-glucose/GDP-mannose dehydrogenase family protein [Metabacillus litoralis]
MNITVAGTGYVGLVTGVSLAEIGHRVVCFDIDKEKVMTLMKGKSPIYEPGLEEMIIKNQTNERLTFSFEPNIAYSNPDIIIIAVGTPGNSDGSADLSYVKKVAKDISKYLKKDKVTVVTKSTVSIGTNHKIKLWIEEDANADLKVDIVSNPEFLREGTAIYDTFNGDRIVIGSENESAAKLLEDVYRPFNLPFVHTDIESAEMIKYASNAFLATKISFINEIANLCEKIGANIEDVSKAVGMDRRIGSDFLQAGLGYGGSCFPKDTNALVQLAGHVQHSFNLLESVIEVNNKQPFLLLQKARGIVGSSFKDKKVAVLGIAFKPNTDDIREAASLILIKELIKDKAIVNVFDPIARHNVEKVFGDLVNYNETIEETIKDTELVFIATEWTQIKTFTISKYKELMKTPNVVDGRNCYSLQDMKKLDITYASVGRKTIIRENV